MRNVGQVAVLVRVQVEFRFEFRFEFGWFNITTRTAQKVFPGYLTP